jgi:hypothetical protein
VNDAPPGPGLRRQMDLSQIVNTAIRIYRLNFGEFLAIAAVTLPMSAIAAIVVGFIDDEAVAAAVSLALLVPTVAIALVAQAAIARAVADIADGMAPDFNDVYGRVLERLGRLWLTALRVIAIFLVLCVTIIGIPFAIYLAVRWAFFAQAIVIEDESSNGATDLSGHLVQGQWWRTFGILLIVGLLASLPTGAVTLVFSAATPVAGGLASAVVAAIVVPFSAGAATLLFFDLQSREREHVSVS